MKKLISFSDSTPLSRVWTAFQLKTTDRIARMTALRKISRQEPLFNKLERTSEYDDHLSYSYRLFDLSLPKSLHEFELYTDRDIGGDSTASLFFDQ